MAAARIEIPEDVLDSSRMTLGWVSDVHLNFLTASGRGRFFNELSAHEVDAWMVSGDIGEADSVIGYLREFESQLPVPTYFVLGNHDFYRGSIARVSANAAGLSSSSERLVWLTDTGYVELDEGVALVGDDGWSDGRFGNPMNTPVELNDFHLISELTDHTRAELVRCLNQLGDEAAARLRRKLEAAAIRCTSVVVVTHVPPFKCACWHEGEISSPDWLPWFSCQATGAAIAGIAAAHPDTQFLVLCGHTHSGGRYSPRANVAVHTASAEYGRPTVQGVIELDEGARRVLFNRSMQPTKGGAT